MSFYRSPFEAPLNKHNLRQNIISAKLAHNNQIKSILLIKPSSLGDIIHSLPVLQAFHDKWPEARIAWLVKDIYLNILEDNPLLDELILLKRNSFYLVIVS